jgi:hypothetical protein
MAQRGTIAIYEIKVAPGGVDHDASLLSLNALAKSLNAAAK